MKRGDNVRIGDGLVHVVRTPGITTQYSTIHCGRHLHVGGMRPTNEPPTCIACVAGMFKPSFVNLQNDILAWDGESEPTVALW